MSLKGYTPSTNTKKKSSPSPKPTSSATSSKPSSGSNPIAPAGSTVTSSIKPYRPSSSSSSNPIGNAGKTPSQIQREDAQLLKQQTAKTGGSYNPTTGHYTSPDEMEDNGGGNRRRSNKPITPKVKTPESSEVSGGKEKDKAVVKPVTPTAETSNTNATAANNPLANAKKGSSPRIIPQMRNDETEAKDAQKLTKGKVDAYSDELNNNKSFIPPAETNNSNPIGQKGQAFESVTGGLGGKIPYSQNFENYIPSASVRNTVTSEYNPIAPAGYTVTSDITPYQQPSNVTQRDIFKEEQLEDRTNPYIAGFRNAGLTREEQYQAEVNALNEGLNNLGTYTDAFGNQRQLSREQILNSYNDRGAGGFAGLNGGLNIDSSFSDIIATNRQNAIGKQMQDTQLGVFYDYYDPNAKVETVELTQTQYDDMVNKFFEANPNIKNMIDAGVLNPNDVADFLFKNIKIIPEPNTGTSSGYRGYRGYYRGGGGGGYRGGGGGGGGYSYNPINSAQNEKENRVYNIMKNWEF